MTSDLLFISQKKHLWIIVVMSRNDPKSFCSDFYRTRFYILMVAQPIQDLSKVPIAHETLGGCLPRLRRSEPVTQQQHGTTVDSPSPRQRSCF
jgi:hypothetical protein